MNLTDNEIIKDMGTCIKYREERECGNCSRIGRYQCAVTLMQDAFGLINRKTAEIEKYQHIKTTINEFWDILLKHKIAKRKEKPTLEEFAEAIGEIESEAIKEFAERLKEKMTLDGGSLSHGHFKWGKFRDYEIDNLVKEMVDK